ncbi:hypothetical protein GBA52_015396 [Prunus armeniaca]|nr:hypothetical protein GBA52_015396 [Prunus armeniaca]
MARHTRVSQSIKQDKPGVKANRPSQEGQLSNIRLVRVGISLPLSGRHMSYDIGNKEEKESRIPSLLGLSTCVRLLKP